MGRWVAPIILTVLFAVTMGYGVLNDVSPRVKVGRGGEDFPYRKWKHIELHILKFYKELMKEHAEIDRFIFDLDWNDPDNY